MSKHCLAEEDDLPPLIDTDNEEEEDELPPLMDTDNEEEDLPPLVDTDNEEEENKPSTIYLSKTIVEESDNDSDLPPLLDTDDEEEQHDQNGLNTSPKTESEDEDDLPPLLDTDDEKSDKTDGTMITISYEEKALNIKNSSNTESEDLPPLIDTDNEEEEDELPPLMDSTEDEEEDLPPLVDTDEEEEKQQIENKTKQIINSKIESEEEEEDLPPLLDESEEEEDLPPLVETTDDEEDLPPLMESDEEKDKEDLPPLLEDEDDLPPLVETTDEENSDEDDDLPPLIEEENSDEDDDLPDLIEEEGSNEDDSDYHSGEDSDDDDFFQATQMRRMQNMEPASISEPVKRRPPRNIEKNKKEWEEYKTKLEESKKRKETIKQREEQKRQQLLQEQQQQLSTQKSQTPTTTTTNEPQIETIELGTCLFCNQTGRTITNKDDYYSCICSNKCKLNFHKECWLKYYRAERNNDRSINCPTEACGGYGEQLSYYEKLADTPKSTTLPAPMVNNAAIIKSKKKGTNKEPVSNKEQSSNESITQKKIKSTKQSSTNSLPDNNLPSLPTTENSQNKKTTPTYQQTLQEPEPEEIKVVLSAGKFAKAVERKKFNDRALEETEKLKNAQLYKTKFVIKTGYDIGVVIELEKPFGKILTTTTTLKCRIESLQLGDLIQFQVLSGNEYAQNIELIERLQNVPQNFPELYGQLKEELKVCQVEFGSSIPFKLGRSKKKKATNSQSTKSNKPSNSIQSSSSGASTTTTTNSNLSSATQQNPTNDSPSSSQQEKRKVFELGDLPDELLSQINWCLGEIVGKKETFGKINVTAHPPSMPEVERIPLVFFHIKNFNKLSVLPNNGDKVLFFLSSQQSGSPSALDIHVVSNDMYEYLQFRLQE